MQSHNGRNDDSVRHQGGGGGGYNDYQYGGGMGGGFPQHRRGVSDNNIYARRTSFGFDYGNTGEYKDDSSMAFDEAFETSVGVPQFVQNTQDRIRHNNLPAPVLRDNLGDGLNRNTNPEEENE